MRNTPLRPSSAGPTGCSHHRAFTPPSTTNTEQWLQCVGWIRRVAWAVGNTVLVGRASREGLEYWQRQHPGGCQAAGGSRGKSEGEHRDGRLALGAAVRQRHALSQNPGRTEVGRWQLPCTGGGLARQDCGQVQDQKTGGVRGGRGRG